ncbi:MAG: Crp/Fnr family transcriptional regulator [Acidobacteriota bacterium]
MTFKFSSAVNLHSPNPILKLPDKEKITVENHCLPTNFANGSSAQNSHPLSKKHQAIEHLSAPMIYPPGVFLLHQGWKPQMVHFIEDGLVKLVYTNEEGAEMIVGLRSTGSVLGVAAAIQNQPVPLAAVTLQPSQIRSLPAHTLVKLLQTDLEFAFQIQQSESTEYYSLVSRFAQQKFGEAKQQLENLLWQIISIMGLDASQNDLKLQLPLKYYELARLIDIEPSYVCKLIKDLEREGIVKRKNGWLILTNPQKLQRLNNFSTFWI